MPVGRLDNVGPPRCVSGEIISDSAPSLTRATALGRAPRPHYTHAPTTLCLPLSYS